MVSGAVAKAGKIDPQALYNALTSKFPVGTKIPDFGQVVVTGLKGYGDRLDKCGINWNLPQNGLQLFMSIYGHIGYRFPFIYLPADMNTIKNRLLSGQKGISKEELEKNPECHRRMTTLSRML